MLSGTGASVLIPSIQALLSSSWIEMADARLRWNMVGGELLYGTEHPPTTHSKPSDLVAISSRFTYAGRASNPKAMNGSDKKTERQRTHHRWSEISQLRLTHSMEQRPVR